MKNNMPMFNKGTLIDLPVFNRFPSADKHHDHAAICQEPSVKDRWHVMPSLVLEHCQNSARDSNHSSIDEWNSGV